MADGMAQYLENHTGPEQGWLGPWEHVRGNERCAEGTGRPDAMTRTSAV